MSGRRPDPGDGVDDFFALLIALRRVKRVLRGLARLGVGDELRRFGGLRGRGTLDAKGQRENLRANSKNISGGRRRRG